MTRQEQALLIRELRGIAAHVEDMIDTIDDLRAIVRKIKAQSGNRRPAVPLDETGTVLQFPRPDEPA